MEDKKTFLLYVESIKANLELLTDEQAGMLLRSITEYVSGNEPKIDSPIVKLAFNNIKLDIDSCNDKYKARCEKNKENIRKRWEKRYDRINRNTNEYEALPNDNDNGNDNDIVSPINIVDTNEKENITKENEVEVLVAEEVIPEPKKEAKRFVKPTQEEVVEYFFEKLHATSNVEAIKFFSYYESNGWRVGRNPMKNWHSAASGWWTRNQQQTQSYGTNKYEKSIAEREQQARDFADYFAAKSAAESQGEGRVSHAILLK